jgi:hypothetical protein
MKLKDVDIEDLNELLVAARLSQAIYEDDTERALLSVCPGAKIIMVNGEKTDTNCAVMMMPDHPTTWRVVFRGTSSWQDVINDINITNATMMIAEEIRVNVHAGFLNCFDEVIKDIGRACRELGYPRPDSRIMTTGHSSGGALAVLLNLRNFNLDSIVFGAPKISTNCCIKMNGWCVEMNGDPVPNLPLTFRKHPYGEMLRLPSRLGLDHPIGGYVAALETELKKRRMKDDTL